MTEIRHSYKFITPVRVRYADTDAQGHVYFANYLVYFDIATTDYMRAIGYPYEKLIEKGYDFYTVEALCRYRGRAYFDEILQIAARISQIGNSSFRYDLAVFRDGSADSIADGHIVNVMVDKNTGKPTRVPDDFREAVQSYEEIELRRTELKSQSKKLWRNRNT